MATRRLRWAIVPPYSGERFNLHEAIWASFVQA
jgi:hypothetical protein